MDITTDPPQDPRRVPVKRNYPMKARKAFTLIELLVVVAIIALLIALILPSLGRAREQAKLVECGTNLKSISNAISAYAGGNQDIVVQSDAFYRDDVVAVPPP